MDAAVVHVLGGNVQFHGGWDPRGLGDVPEPDGRADGDVEPAFRVLGDFQGPAQQVEGLGTHAHGFETRGMVDSGQFAGLDPGAEQVVEAADLLKADGQRRLRDGVAGGHGGDLDQRAHEKLGALDRDRTYNFPSPR